MPLDATRQDWDTSIGAALSVLGGSPRQDSTRLFALMRQWTRFVTAHPKACATIAILVTLVLGSGLTRLGFDIQPNATITSDNQASRDLARLKSVFGPDDNDLVVMVESKRLLEWDQLQAMRELRDRIRALPEVEHVSSIFDLRQPGHTLAPLIPLDPPRGYQPNLLRLQLARHPIAANQLISSDGTMAVLWARIAGGSLPVSTIESVVTPTHQYARDYEESTGARVLLAGHPAVRADVLMTLQRAMVISCIAAAVISFLVALLLFRAIGPVLVVVTAPTIGAIWTFGLMGWCGEAVGGLTSALPNLVFVIGLTDAVHLLLDGQRHLLRGSSRQHCVYRMLIRIGPACLLTALTTMIGFGSLALSRTDSVQNFGLWAALGTTLVVLSDVLVLPTILQYVPTRYIVGGRAERDTFTWWIERIVAPTLRRPGLTTTCGLFLCAALIGPAISQHPDIIWTEAIPDDSSSTMAMLRADEKLGGALVAYVVIEWPEELEFPDRRIAEATSKTQIVLRDAADFDAPFSVLNVLAAVPGNTVAKRYQRFQSAPAAMRRSLLNTTERCLVVSARVPNDGAAALNQRVARIDSQLRKLAEQFPGFGFTVTGTVVAASRNMNAIILDLARSLAIAAVLIFFVFAVTFRSLKVGVLSVIPNALPLLASAAGLTLLGYPLQITSAITFSLCLGLAVDDTMHVLIRYRAARKFGCDANTAIRRTIRHVGPALVVTTLILVAGFGAMMTSPLPGVRMFACLSALTLGTALIGDLLIFPAMLVYASSDRRD